ncbi:hypothetical protein CMUS01_14298 [Colletotrichum musicola]|uniref:Secreted protein n=1 Tax=Colletotrichum musicola TaxID=2175873 RepID=A0A8H6J5X3_9PEZI|nr:hypothetical protein CMUS01_14298 [Colletotrichum musicola]
MFWRVAAVLWFRCFCRFGRVWRNTTSSSGDGSMETGPITVTRAPRSRALGADIRLRAFSGSYSEELSIRGEKLNLSATELLRYGKASSNIFETCRCVDMNNHRPQLRVISGSEE